MSGSNPGLGLVQNSHPVMEIVNEQDYPNNLENSEDQQIYPGEEDEHMDQDQMDHDQMAHEQMIHEQMMHEQMAHQQMMMQEEDQDESNQGASPPQHQ